MNAYAPPEAEVRTPERAGASLRRRLVLLPLFAAGALFSSAAVFVLCRLIPIAGGSPRMAAASALGLAALAAVGGAAFWWLPLARTYRKHAFWAGLVAGALPAALRIWSRENWSASTFSQIVAAVDTLGVALAFAVGAALVARRLGANNSSKPTPLRGAA